MSEGVLSIEIRVNANGRGTLLVNGVDMSRRVRKASFETIGCKVTEVTLVLLADSVAVDGEAVVTIKATE